MNSRPPIVLGVCSGTHDSAAALIVDGDLIGLVEEERLNGVKHTNASPDAGVEWLLDRAGITAADVTTVAYNFSPACYRRAVLSSLALIARPQTRARALARARGFAVVANRTRQRMRALGQRFPHAQVRGVAHHRAHSVYAFAASGYDAAAVLIIDSLGETATTTIAHASATGRGMRCRALQVIRDPASLGYAYGAITEHLGWRRGDEEGTVMALAALGDPGRFRGLLATAIRVSADAFTLDPRLLPLRVISSRYPRVSPAFVAAACSPRQPGEEVRQVHADLAAALQERTEQVMVHLARRARGLSGARLLCVGGGVAMNCVGIGRIVEDAGFDEVCVPPRPAIPARLPVPRSPPAWTPPACWHPAPHIAVFSARPLRAWSWASSHARDCTPAASPAPRGFWPANSPRERSSACSKAGWKRDPEPWATARSSPHRCGQMSSSG